jgi:hypothetical protein
MPRSTRFAVAVLLTAATACSTPMTAPEMVADSGLTFESAHARWLATRSPDYSFEFEAQSAGAPAPGYYRATVVGGRLMVLQRSYSGEIAPIEEGFTIDQLWGRLAEARAAGVPLSELQFSQEGIPIQAAVGSTGADRGVRYRLRWYTVGRTQIF